MENIYTTLRVLGISLWLVNFSPYQDFLMKYIKPRIPNRLSYLKTALSCFMCYSFWLTLIFTQDFILACGASGIAYTYNRLMNSLKTYL
jgi:hypothetical protein